MPQTRWWNFKADDATKDINRWLTGIVSSGMYFGFDFAPSANMNLTLDHLTTGFKDVAQDGTESDFQGIIVTRNGIVIKQDNAITINGIANGHATNPRIDIVVITQIMPQVSGGATGLYSVIQGTPGATPAAPALTNTQTQIKIGELYIPALTTALNQAGVKWTRSGRPGYGDTASAVLESQDLNDIRANGLYTQNGSTLNGALSGYSHVIHQQANFAYTGGLTNTAAQIFIHGTTDRMFFRRKVSDVWQAWSEITGALGGITGAITTVISSNLTANRAVISNSSGKIAASVTTDTELGYVAGVTSAIQTQINSKQATITGAITTVLSSNLTVSHAVASDASGKIIASNTTLAELEFVAGVGSAIQTQINSKQATITGAASTIVSSNLTVSRVAVSNASGKVDVAATTITEVERLAGVAAGRVVTSLESTSLSGYKLRFKVVEIVDWNMDNTELKSVAHGLGSDWVNIRSINVMIRDDAASSLSKLDGRVDSYSNIATDSTDGAILLYETTGPTSGITSANITLVRRTGGVFDSASFDSVAGYVRGWITIGYEIAN